VSQPERAVDLLSQGIAELGIEPRESLLRALLGHLREIEGWNPSLGLVNASGAELVIRHTLDSLAGAHAFRGLPPGASVVDVGSGAGFPGIPLAIARPELRFVLVERSTRRCTFLDHCAASLGLANVTVFAGEARSYRGAADAVTFRAVSELTPAFLRSCGALGLAPLLVAYKGTLERARAELGAVRGLFGSADLEPIRVPFLDGERTLLLLRR
jgi:16S rRNA (guanine527-N7)-methyltransferase